MTLLAKIVLITFLLSSSVVRAYAGLIGSSVLVNSIFGPTKDDVLGGSGPSTITAEGTIFAVPGVDFTVFDTVVTVESQVLVPATYFSSYPFNGFRLTNLTGFPAITGVTIDPSTTIALDDSRVTFDSTHVWLNMVGLTVPPGLDVKLDLQFVPEPATFAMMCLGFVGLVFLGRRQL